MEFLNTKFHNMPLFDARGKFILTWKHLPLPAMEILSVMKIKMNKIASKPHQSSFIQWLQLPSSISF